MGQDEGRRRMRIAYVDAARLAAENWQRHDDVGRRHAELSAQVEQEEVAQNERRRDVHDGALEPFRDCFAHLKNVDLVPLEPIVLPTPQELPAVDYDAVRVPALGLFGSLAAGVAAGAGAGSATVTGVGAFAAASTGTPIASLSGVAATNAMLAWLGGGSLAAGGGGMAAGSVVLGGVAAAPVIIAAAGFVSWRGRRDRRAQLVTADLLVEAEAGLAAEERRTAALIAHCAEVRSVLAESCAEIVDRLPSFSVLVDADNDYANWNAGQRRFLADLVELVTVTVALMAAPPADCGGGPHEDSERLLGEARTVVGDRRAPGADAA